MSRQEKHIPWTEKYRPDNFDKIILNSENRIFFNEILKKNIFPNILLYGPPGTGKTTTIINIIDRYQQLNNQVDKSLVIHLNASDDRGIDVIRNNISQFVNSNTLFTDGIKFIILDEVDYMTKNAQQALKQLLKINNEKIRFCLICNYISRIDDGLLEEFIVVRFNQLPEKSIIHFLDDINKQEQLDMPIETLQDIKKYYNSDIRSMINYMQNHINIYNDKQPKQQNETKESKESKEKQCRNSRISTISDELLKKIFNCNINKSVAHFNDMIICSSTSLLIDYRIILKKYINYLVTHQGSIIAEKNIKSDLQFIYTNITTSKSIPYIYYLLSNK